MVLPDPPRARGRRIGRRLAGLVALVLVAGGALVATGAHESAWVRQNAPWLVEPGTRLDDLARDAGDLLSSVRSSVTPSEIAPGDAGGLEAEDAAFAAPDSLPELRKR